MDTLPPPRASSRASAAAALSLSTRSRPTPTSAPTSTPTPAPVRRTAPVATNRCWTSRPASLPPSVGHRGQVREAADEQGIGAKRLDSLAADRSAWMDRCGSVFFTDPARSRGRVPTVPGQARRTPHGPPCPSTPPCLLAPTCSPCTPTPAPCSPSTSTSPAARSHRHRVERAGRRRPAHLPGLLARQQRVHRLLRGRAQLHPRRVGGRQRGLRPVPGRRDYRRPGGRGDHSFRQERPALRHHRGHGAGRLGRALRHLRLRVRRDGLPGRLQQHLPAMLISSPRGSSPTAGGAPRTPRARPPTRPGTTSPSSTRATPRPSTTPGNDVWAPLMSGGGYRSEITQWSAGEYAGATSKQDQVQALATRLGTRTDDYGDSPPAPRTCRAPRGAEPD